MQDFRPEEILVEVGSEKSPIFANLRKAFPEVPVSFVDHPRPSVDDLSASNDPFGKGKRRLFLQRHKGNFLKKCPGSDGQVCCNYFVVNFASNCPMQLLLPSGLSS
jgi:spore photoproduct lyase